LVSKAGVKKALLDLFLGNRMILKPTLNGNLIDALRTYLNAHTEFFRSNSLKPPQPNQIKQLILMLLASKILTPKILFDEADIEKQSPLLLHVARLRMPLE
jgi:hypothetical protein